MLLELARQWRPVDRQNNQRYIVMAYHGGYSAKCLYRVCHLDLKHCATSAQHQGDHDAGRKLWVAVVCIRLAIANKLADAQPDTTPDYGFTVAGTAQIFTILALTTALLGTSKRQRRNNNALLTRTGLQLQTQRYQ